MTLILVCNCNSIKIKLFFYPLLHQTDFPAHFCLLFWILIMEIQILMLLQRSSEAALMFSFSLLVFCLAHLLFCLPSHWSVCLYHLICCGSPLVHFSIALAFFNLIELFLCFQYFCLSLFLNFGPCCIAWAFLCSPTRDQTHASDWKHRVWLSDCQGSLCMF